MKLDTLIEGHEGNCRAQEPNPITSIYGETSHHNFCFKKLVRSITLKVLEGINYRLDTLIDDYQRKFIVQEW